ncbi:hypothetical protein GCM10027614_47570 [Micromonospora vulcania]
MRIRPVGAHALLLDCTASADVPVPALVEAWRAELWRRRTQGELIAAEIVPAANTVLLDGLPDSVATAELLSRWARTVTAAVEGEDATGRVTADAEVVVPVDFDGPDLPTVAEHWGSTCRPCCAG